MLKDPGVFDIAWVPGDLRHREDELQSLATSLTRRSYYDTPLRIIGPSGVGKTAVVRYALEDMEQNAEDIRTAYVDAWTQRRSRRTLHALLSDLAPTTGTLHPDSKAKDLLDGIREAVVDRAVVVIDEADMLQDSDLLVELHAIEHLHLVLVANRDDDIVDELGTIQSKTLQDGHRLDFEPYSVSALIDILRPRAAEGIYGGVEDDVLEGIAERADGDARNAIKCLEMATRMADARELGRLDEDLVDEAMERAKAYVRQKASERLRREEHVIYNIVREKGEAQMGEIYRTYESRVADPKTQRSVRKWLRKMTAYNLLESEGQTADRVYKYVEVPDELIGWLRQSA